MIGADLEKKFQTLMDKNFIPYATIMDYISSTIKQIVFPSVSYDVAEQKGYHGKKYAFREAGNVLDKFQGQIDITFKSVDSHLNYFILLEISNNFYMNNPNFLDELSILILDKDGDLIYSIILHEVLIRSLSEIQLSYNATSFNEQTFSLQISYNIIDIVWEIGYDDTEKGKSIFDIDIKQGDPRYIDTLVKEMNIRKIESEKRIEE
jgi:hypothetical protein